MALPLLQCKQEDRFLVAPKGQIIQSSFVLTADSLRWALEDKEVGIVVEGDELVLDFNGAIVYGHNFGEAPSQQTGTAIHIKKAKHVTIKNATFLGFKDGILADEVDTLLIENCVFDYGFRPNPADPINFGHAVLVKKNKQLVVIDSKVSHWESGIGIVNGAHFKLSKSELSFISGSGIVLPEGCSALIDHCALYFVGNPAKPRLDDTYGFLFENGWDPAMQISQSVIAHCKSGSTIQVQSLSTNNWLAYDPYIPQVSSSSEKVDSFLLQKGIAIPSLLLQDEYGQYDHSYPKAWLREQDEEKDIFLLTAPQGNWRLVGGEGYDRVVPKTGTFPVTITAFRSDTSQSQSLEFEYLGKSAQRYGLPIKGTIPFAINSSAPSFQDASH